MSQSDANCPIRVVIPCYHSLSTITQTLQAIFDSDYQGSVEVVLVDDSGEYLQLQQKLHDFKISIITSKFSGCAGRARNLGARGFYSGILIFIDADVIIARDCISQLIAPILAGSASASVGSYRARLLGNNFASNFKDLYLEFVYGRKALAELGEFWSAIGAVRAEAFHSCAGYDERYRGAAGEDTVFGATLVGMGYKILSVPSAYGFHNRKLTLLSLIANDWKKGVVAARQIFSGQLPKHANRHSGSSDILAVLSAAVSLPLLVLACFTNSQYSVAALIALTGCVVSYISLRLSLIKFIFQRSIAMCVASIGVIWLLDLLRFACVLAALPTLLGTLFSSAAPALVSTLEEN